MAKFGERFKRNTQIARENTHKQVQITHTLHKQTKKIHKSTNPTRGKRNKSRVHLKSKRRRGLINPTMGMLLHKRRF